jgi:hypothetical protein
MEDTVVLHDDMPHGRFVAELPGGLVVQALTGEGLMEQLRDLGVAGLPGTLKSWHTHETSPVSYRDANGGHVFSDRGRSLVIEGELATVTDDQIMAVIQHAIAQFGQPLALTGDSQIFVRRMARICAEQGIAVANPELQDYMADAVARQRAKKVIPFRARASRRSTDSATQ